MQMEKEIAPHILLVEDEESLGFLLRENLKLSGFSVTLCKDGAEGWETFKTEKFDACIFDVNMPKKNGFELAEDVRQRNQTVPIIFLTANSAEEDKLKGFEIGGDEYITKPFSTQELVARLKAILKRSKKTGEDISEPKTYYEVGNISIDFTNHILKVKDQESRISTTEAELLKIFILNKNEVLSRNTLLLAVWGREDFYTSRSLDVYLTRIRKMLKGDNSIEIANIHGIGFKLAENVNAG